MAKVSFVSKQALFSLRSRIGVLPRCPSKEPDQMGKTHFPTTFDLNHALAYVLYICDSSISDFCIVWKTASHISIAIWIVAVMAVPPGIPPEGESAGESELAMDMSAELDVRHRVCCSGSTSCNRQCC
jgi:hypothetical protein